MANGVGLVHIPSMSAIAEPAPHLHMDATLRPHRSLSKRGFVILLIILAIYNLLVAAFLVMIGAFPVPIFLGIDFLAVFIAFRVSYGRGQAAEHIQVTSDLVRVSHRFGRVERTVWTSPTAFTRVQLERVGEHEAHVRLYLSGRTMSVAGSLGHSARAHFATRLEAAIQAARAERYAG
jgi:uncharacterized membrane protein